MQIGIIGDLHFKENLNYSEYVFDRRVKEKKLILDTIVNSFSDCEKIVLLGDNLNSKNNTSETIRCFVEFIEKFKEKEVFILAGNHEKFGSGKSAIDFLKEINKKNWHVIINEVHNDNGLIFCPYFHNSELDAKNHREAVKKLLDTLNPGEYLFVHHTISNSKLTNNCNVDDLNEIVLPYKELSKNYKKIFAGHIHLPQNYDKIYVTGSVFTNEIGETEKFVYKLDTEKNDVEKIRLPVTPLYKVENPSVEDLSSLDKNGIIKAIINKKELREKVEEIKIELQKFKAYLFVEQYPNERKKINSNEKIINFSIEELLKLYAKERDVDYKLLKSGFELIN